MARKGPRMTKETVRKIVNNPRTPPGLRAYWRKRLAKM